MKPQSLEGLLILFSISISAGADISASAQARVTIPSN